MNFKIQDPKELTQDRVDVINEYVELQEKLKHLNEKNILTNFLIKIQKLQNEVDLDKLSEEEMKKIGELKGDELEEYRNSLPQIEREYWNDAFLIAPYYIGAFIFDNKVMCLDQLDTETIQTINGFIKTKVDFYGDF